MNRTELGRGVSMILYGVLCAFLGALGYRRQVVAKVLPAASPDGPSQAWADEDRNDQAHLLTELRSWLGVRRP